MYEPSFFAEDLHDMARQVLPKHIYDKYGITGLRYMDERILQSIDCLRKNLGKPITVNNWFWGGDRNASGYRDVVYYGDSASYAKSSSQHKYGRGLDFKVKGMHAYEVREHIIMNKHLYPHITFLEVGPISDGRTMSWVHIDCRMQPNVSFPDESIIYWSPKLKYVSEQYVLDHNL